MGLGDILLCIFLPPFASGVRQRGCFTMLMVGILTLLVWVPGVIAAFIMTLSKPQVPPTIIVQNYTGEPPTDAQ